MRTVALTNLKSAAGICGRQHPPCRCAARRRQRGRTNNSSIQAVVSQNLTKLTDVIRPTPYMVQGTASRISRVPGPQSSNSLPRSALRPGDIIKDIDGQSLTDRRRAMQIFQSLGTADQVTVTVERNGQSESLVLSTKQLDLGGEQ